MEASPDNKQLVETFCALTSTTPEEATFFLESHNFDLDSAVSTFFENSDSTQQHQQLTESPSPSPTPAIFSSNPQPVSMDSRDKKPASRKPASTSRVRTLADLNRGSDHDHGSGSDSDTPQEYYTGGEKSGIAVQGPPKKGNDVDSIFDQARQVAVDAPALHSSSSSRSFTGTGRLLLSGEQVMSAPPPPEDIVHNITFWRNGFTVNDGPLRSLGDPENGPFMQSIMRSECPKELEPADRRTQVRVNLSKREGDFPEPEVRQVSFQGAGRTLGSSSSSTETSAAVDRTTAAAAAPPLTTAPTPSVGLIVNGELPSTSIQLRLADGTRMVARFNYHHTISDIRAFIDASRPGSPRTYTLQTVGFPPKQLTDVSQTIEDAKLANSVVLQKL